MELELEFCSFDFQPKKFFPFVLKEAALQAVR